MLVIENDFSSSGGTNDVKNAYATIQYMGLEDDHPHVPRAYWRDHREAVISISPGQREHIILGQHNKRGYWFYYANPQSYPKRYQRYTNMGEEYWLDPDNFHENYFQIKGHVGIRVVVFSRQNKTVKLSCDILLTCGDGQTPDLEIAQR